MLRVMTANVAHGRADGFHQFFQRRSTIEGNLRRFAAVIAREAPEVVALQEADGPSAWSGGFDHVEFIAKEAGYDFVLRGEHMRVAGLSYGTALISRLPLRQGESVAFARSLPTPTKGFVVASVAHPAGDDVLVDVVSLHLDFARASVRRRQVARVARVLRERARPVAVMGDFNTDWTDDHSALRRLAADLDLSVWDPDDRGDPTFPLTNGRIDWILHSRALRFASRRVLPDIVSDHRAIVADLALEGVDPALDED